MRRRITRRKPGPHASRSASTPRGRGYAEGGREAGGHTANTVPSNQIFGGDSAKVILLQYLTCASSSRSRTRTPVRFQTFKRLVLPAFARADALYFSVSAP